MIKSLDEDSLFFLGTDVLEKVWILALLGSSLRL